MRQRKIARVKYSVVLVLISMLVIITCSIAFGCSLSSAHGDSQQDITERYYKSIEIQKGTNLWNIAKEYKPDTMNTQEYMQELCRMNQIQDPDAIHAGQYLIVSYDQTNFE